MNLLQEGAHAAADWVHYKIEAHRGATVVYAHPTGQLAAGYLRQRDPAHPQSKRRPPGYLFGPVVFERPLTYKARLALFTELRTVLLAQRDQDRAA